MLLKRFVTYIYEYEGGSRTRNAGYIRTDIRDDACRMEVHIRLGDRTDGKGAVFLVADEAAPVGVPAGELLLTQGAGHLRLTCPQNRLGKSGYIVSQLLAFVVRLEDGRVLCGSFVSEPDEAVMRGEFAVWSPVGRGVEQGDTEKTQRQPETPAVDETEETPPQATEQPPAVLPPTDSADVSPQSPDIESQDLPKSPPPAITYERIEITDIRRLPKRNWHLCSNSFLVHGFFNYHYLILKTVEQEGQAMRFLGVPGLYEQQERMMALLFGFPEFEAAQPDDADRANVTFGYWMCPVAESLR
jgi:hypothetical protein